jgi:hypothetical protein
VSSQLDLLGGTPTTEPRLTDRQEFALETIGRLQPISSDELGAHLHAYRQANGGRGHDPDTRCDWCTQEGRDMGAALRKKGLVVQRRMAGWCLVGAATTNGIQDGYDPSTAVIPF